MIGTTGAGGKVSLLGKPSPLLPSSYHQPLIIDAAANNGACFVDGEFMSGAVIIGDQSPALKAYFLGASSSTAAIGLSATTNFLSFPSKLRIDRIDVVFGEPLIAGDAFNIDTKLDADSTAEDFGTASFALDGAIRRKSMLKLPGLVVDSQVALILNFVTGHVKVQRVEIYGHYMPL